MHIVGTHGYFLQEDEKEQGIMRPYPTLGLLYISSFLKAHQKEVSIVDSTFLTTEQWKAELSAIAPTVIAFYTNLMTKVKILELVNWCKVSLPNATLIVGGPDVTYNKENYLHAGFDFVVSGEGEQTMLELITAIEKDTSTNDIPGVSYLKDDTLVIGPERTKIKEIEELPFPDRSAIPIEKYLSVWKKHHGKRTLNISTQRGCPYTCKWCSTAVYGQSYRRNSPRRVVEEIKSLVNDYAAEALWFVDDVFTVSHKWIKELHGEFQKNELTIPFECITRAERLNPEILALLKQMGCFRIWIGAESGSQKIIDKMDRRVDLTTVQAMIQETQEQGMEAGTFIMVGYPDENLEDLQQTLEHIQKCNPNYLTITKAYPIKGTGLYNEVKEKFTNQPEWKTSTDRDITFELPYSDKFYGYSIRYLVNGWIANREKSMKHKLKSWGSYQMMMMHKKFRANDN